MVYTNLFDAYQFNILVAIRLVVSFSPLVENPSVDCRSPDRQGK